jgi:hypothetical protein
MTTDQDAPLAAERMLEARRNQRAFEQRQVADPNLAHLPRWTPHRPWRATPSDWVMTGLGVVILVGGIVIWLFF